MDDSDQEYLNVCFTVDEPFVQHACVTLHSLLISNQNLKFNVYFFSFGITAVSKRKIELFSQAFRSRLRIDFIHTDISLVNGFKVTGHSSPVNYLRIFIPHLIPEVSKVLYLDSDLIIVGSIKELFDLDLDSYCLAAVPTKDLEMSKILDIADDAYFNSGVLMLNLAYWKNHGITEKLKYFILENPHKIIYWDQDALNALLTHSYFKLEEKWNYTKLIAKLDLKKNDVRIVHYAGAHKPWSVHYPKGFFKRLYFRFLINTPFFKENFFFNVKNLIHLS